jgi:hypothetical protein
MRKHRAVNLGMPAVRAADSPQDQAEPGQHPACRICSPENLPRRQGHRTAQPARHGFNQNQIWCELVAMGCELTAWMQMLALHGPARARNTSGCASPRPGPGPPRSPPR